VRAHLAGEEIDDAVDELVEDDLAGEGGIAVEAEGLLGDLGDPGEFGVGGFEEPLNGTGDVGVGELEDRVVGRRRGSSPGGSGPRAASRGRRSP